MSPERPVIKPQQGFCDLAFGKSMPEAEKRFGKPEETEILETGSEFKTTVWHYWSRGYSLFFDEGANQIFTCAEIDNPDTLLWEKKIFELSEEQLIKLFNLHGFKKVECEEHEWGEKRVSFDDAQVDLYFENGQLTSINYGILPETDGEKVLILPN